MSAPMGIEGQRLVRRSVGDASGLTVAAQIRQAARNLGYPADSWRIREAWYGRSSCWSAQAMRDLQDAAVRWWEREQYRLDNERRTQAAANRNLLLSQRDHLAAELKRLNSRLALLDGDIS